MSRTALGRALVMIALVASCTSGQPSSPSPTPGPPLTTAELTDGVSDNMLWHRPSKTHAFRIHVHISPL
jgi:hypothetical protein